MWFWLLSCALNEGKPRLTETAESVEAHTGVIMPSTSGKETSPPATDSAVNEDTAAETSPDLPLATVAATALKGPLRRCASPELRDESPYQRHDLRISYTEGYSYEGSALVVADLFGDRRPALLFGGDHVKVYRAATRGWEDVSTQVLPLIDLRHVVTGSAVDFDGDGDLDLFLGAHGANHMLQNDDGVFHSISDEVWAHRPAWTSVSSSWADIDGDGDLDLMVGNYLGDGHRTPVDVHPSELYLNEKGHFLDVSDRLPSETQQSFVFMTAFLDIGGDHYPDLFSVHGFSGSGPSRLLYNSGGTGWIIDDSSGFHPGFDGMGITFADLNEDGSPDIAQTSHNTISLRLSSPAKEALSGWGWQIEHAGAYGVDIDLSARGQSVGWGIEFGDMDNDSDQDLVATYGYWETFPPDGYNYDALWEQGSSGQFEEVAEAWGVDDSGIGRSLALVDLNRDGWLDIIKREIRTDVAHVHESRCGASHWIGVRPTQPGSLNRFGVGAVVDVWNGLSRQRRWIMAGSTSMFSSGPPEAHFGLGTHPQVDHVVVTWPDGEVSVLDDLESDHWYRIVREHP